MTTLIYKSMVNFIWILRLSHTNFALKMFPQEEVQSTPVRWLGRLLHRTSSSNPMTRVLQIEVLGELVRRNEEGLRLVGNVIAIQVTVVSSMSRWISRFEVPGINIGSISIPVTSITIWNSLIKMKCRPWSAPVYEWKSFQFVKITFSTIYYTFERYHWKTQQKETD